MRSCSNALVRSMIFIFLVLAAVSMPSQAPHGSPSETAVGSPSYSEQTAEILGLTSLLEKLRSLQSQRACGSPASVEELALRQNLLESIEAASLEVDGVVAEIANERADLSDVRSTLQSRRDHSVALTSAANLITGTGLGIVVNALQFKDSTALLGDGIGVGSGVASTVLSIVAIRQQRGPRQGIGAVPNMLAPLLNEEPVLNTYYPPEVLKFLKSVPPGQDALRGTRLDQLMADWAREGRLEATDSVRRQQKIAALTTSMSKTVKVSIDDLTDRSAMLGDVSGRVTLLKRDMAAMMRLQRKGDSTCGPSVPVHQ